MAAGGASRSRNQSKTRKKRSGMAGEDKTAAEQARLRELRLQFPTIEDLRRRARLRIPRFAYDYVDGAAGQLEEGKARNAAALDAIEMAPRFGLDNFKADMKVELFGKTYALPTGIAPMGMPGMVWPGGEMVFARTAAKANIPFVLGNSAWAAIEDVAGAARGNAWFQLYRQPHNDLEFNFDLIRRCTEIDVPVIVVTLDVPARTKRPRELRNRLLIPFRTGWKTYLDAGVRPFWLMALRKHGTNAFANFTRYAPPGSTNKQVVQFMRARSGGSFSWEEVARFRDAWPHAMVVKGLLHPGDAEKAVELGVDGVLVSNHGGRQLEGAPAPIDVLPAIVSAVGERATVLFDSGVRSGEDIVRALALGAKSTLSGRAFMFGLGALGEEGPDYVAEYFDEEIGATLRHVGAHNLAEARDITLRHPGAWVF
jgi:(S)-mandelate dehydrogenase